MCNDSNLGVEKKGLKGTALSQNFLVIRRITWRSSASRPAGARPRSGGAQPVAVASARPHHHPSGGTSGPSPTRCYLRAASYGREGTCEGAAGLPGRRVHSLGFVAEQTPTNTGLWSAFEVFGHRRRQLTPRRRWDWERQACCHLRRPPPSATTARSGAIASMRRGPRVEATWAVRGYSGEGPLFSLWRPLHPDLKVKGEMDSALRGQ